MNDPHNAPVEPHDDGTIQDEPLYQEPSEGIVTHVDEGDSRSGATNPELQTKSHGDEIDSHRDEPDSRRP